MKILSIETSCDETAVSIVEATGGLENPSFAVLGNALFSQIDIHKEYGGVVPMIAKREHIKRLPILLEQVLVKAGMSPDKLHGIDVISVTAGPGLEPALWTGITFAEELGKKWNVPVVGANHMEGHIASVLINAGENKIQFPAIALLISGGHTELVEIKNWGEYKILGETRDDAVGEAFDKVARMLSLPYPGGPQISKLAQIAREKNLPRNASFPRPMIHSHDLDFSFAGLKTSVLYYLRDNFPNNINSQGKEIMDTDKEDIAREFEDAVVDVLTDKTKRSLDETGAHTLIIAGGVIANKKLREAFGEFEKLYPGLSVKTPTLAMTGDNALMIAGASYINVILYPELLTTPQKIVANGNLRLE